MDKLSFSERERLDVLSAERELHMDAITAIDDEAAEIHQNAAARVPVSCPGCGRVSDVFRNPQGQIVCPMIHP